MALSRRDFVRRLGAGGAAVASASAIIGYGHEELLAFTGQAAQRPPRPAGPAPIRLSSNENLRGPSPKVIEVLKAAPVEGPRSRLSAAERAGFPGRDCGDVGRQAEQRHDGHRVWRGAGRRRPGLLPDGEAARDCGSVIRLAGADGATQEVPDQTNRARWQPVPRSRQAGLGLVGRRPRVPVQSEQPIVHDP